jgi:mRNA-degrading endonuclease toxin of MazEF toxin-antitoxin module
MGAAVQPWQDRSRLRLRWTRADQGTPPLIISRTDECEQGLPLQVVAITKNIATINPKYHFMVQSSRRVDAKVGLNEPCAVQCNWVREIEQHRVIRTLGYLDDDMLELIIDTVNNLLDDPDFDDWQ